MRVTRGSWVDLNSGPPVLSLSAATCPIISLGVGDHGAQFEDGDGDAEATDDRVPVDHRATVLELDPDRRHDQHGRREGEQGDGQSYVHAPLDGRPPLGPVVGLDIEHGDAGHRRHADAMARQPTEPGPDLHVETGLQGSTHDLGAVGSPHALATTMTPVAPALLARSSRPPISVQPSAACHDPVRACGAQHGADAVSQLGLVAEHAPQSGAVLVGADEDDGAKEQALGTFCLQPPTEPPTHDEYRHRGRPGSNDCRPS